jgi:hypothetical protein
LRMEFQVAPMPFARFCGLCATLFRSRCAVCRSRHP